MWVVASSYQFREVCGSGDSYCEYKLRVRLLKIPMPNLLAFMIVYYAYSMYTNTTPGDKLLS